MVAQKPSKLLERVRFPSPACRGEWRSLVAHPAGGRAVAGSNPVSPIGWCLAKASKHRRKPPKTRGSAWGPQRRIRARRMGRAAVRQRGHDVPLPGLPARRRSPRLITDLEISSFLGHPILHVCQEFDPRGAVFTRPVATRWAAGTGQRAALTRPRSTCWMWVRSWADTGRSGTRSSSTSGWTSPILSASDA